jgi:uncharacterized membrane protein
MFVHAVAFVLYSVTIIVYYTFSMIYYLNVNDQTFKNLYTVWIICESFNFFAQLCLIVILWQLSVDVEFEEEESCFDAIEPLSEVSVLEIGET